MNRSLRSLIALLALLALPAVAGAQINSNQAQVQLNASAPSQALSVSVTPGVLNFTLSAVDRSPADRTLQVTTAYTDVPPGSNVTLSFYFADPVALSAGASIIGASQVSGSIDGDLFQPFVNPTVFGGVGIEKVFPVDGPGSTLTSLDMSIDATGMTIDSGVYTGVLFIQAQAL